MTPGFQSEQLGRGHDRQLVGRLQQKQVWGKRGREV